MGKGRVTYGERGGLRVGKGKGRENGEKKRLSVGKEEGKLGEGRVKRACKHMFF